MCIAVMRCCKTFVTVKHNIYQYLQLHSSLAATTECRLCRLYSSVDHTLRVQTVSVKFQVATGHMCIYHAPETYE